MFKPPLTREQLHEMAVRKNADDVIALLWEVKRLRAMVLTIDQLQRSMTVSGGLETLLASLRAKLNVEPCVIEDERLRSDD